MARQLSHDFFDFLTVFWYFVSMFKWHFWQFWINVKWCFDKVWTDSCCFFIWKITLGKQNERQVKKTRRKREEDKKGEQRNERAPLNERIMHLRETTPKPKNEQRKTRCEPLEGGPPVIINNQYRVTWLTGQTFAIFSSTKWTGEPKIRLTKMAVLTKIRLTPRFVEQKRSKMNQKP